MAENEQIEHEYNEKGLYKTVKECFLCNEFEMCLSNYLLESGWVLYGPENGYDFPCPCLFKG